MEATPSGGRPSPAEQSVMDLPGSNFERPVMDLPSSAADDVVLEKAIDRSSFEGT